MIFRYRVEFEFEAESLFMAQQALNEAKVTEQMCITKSLEAICSEDRIIPRKWVPKKEASVVTFPDAAATGEEPEDDLEEHLRDGPSGPSPKPSNSRLATQSGQIEEEAVEPPF